MKDRDLSIVDFLHELQKEYMYAVMRSKIYPKRKDREYWNMVIKYKEEKILDISFRNNLKNIFNDELKYNEYNLLIRPIKGFPKEMTPNDFKFYFSDNQNFRADGQTWISHKNDLKTIKMGFIDLIHPVSKNIKRFRVLDVTRIF